MIARKPAESEAWNMLYCPFCRTAVKRQNERLVCSNPECGCNFGIVGGIPVMLLSEAGRPCPKCGHQRDFLPEQNLLRCQKCLCELIGK